MNQSLAELRARRLRGDRGFTLIELLVVIVILGILAAVVVFAVGGITDRGQDSACESDERSVRTAQEAFYAESDVDPPAYAASTAALATAGFLAEESVMHSTAPADGPDADAAAGDAYTITAIGDCA